MHELILWSGFFGAWLLVAGPLYQAALELSEEDISRDDMAGVERPLSTGETALRLVVADPAGRVLEAAAVRAG